MQTLIGIDLGTTNSCVATMKNGTSTIIPSSTGARTTPSIVAFAKNGERLVGQPAKNQAVINSERTIVSIKRKMGSDSKIKIDDKKYSPQEISAMILTQLKKDAEKVLGTEVKDAVITVPAYFTDSQRQATKDAGRIAGLNVVRIINEPTAAALAYGLDRQEDQKIMVYDLGGGTFDVSILEISKGVIEVLATSGNNHLGGDDFDNEVIKYIVNELKIKHNLNISSDPQAKQRVREAAEAAKIELSKYNKTEILLPFIGTDKYGPVNFESTLTRDKFNEITKHLVEMTKGPVMSAIKDAGIKISEIDKVLMVGGSTRIPAVNDLVFGITGKQPFKGINPDECVALGAAIQSGVLAGTVTDILLLDITPLSLGIETVGNHFAKVISRNTTIPIKKSQIFTTNAPYQSSVIVHVLQGEKAEANLNKSLGKFNLRGIRRAPAGVPQIEVTFTIDVNGIVNVQAKDLDTGKRQEITLEASTNLSEAEIQNAIHDEMDYEEKEAIRKQLYEKKEIAMKLVEQAKAKMKENKSSRKQLKPLVSKVEKSLRSNDEASIILATQELEESLRKF
mgnify:CR=1 FL=1